VKAVLSTKETTGAFVRAGVIPVGLLVLVVLSIASYHFGGWGGNPPSPLEASLHKLCGKRSNRNTMLLQAGARCCNASIAAQF